MTKLVAYGLFLFEIALLCFPLSGTAQTAAPWTPEQCRARMDELFNLGITASDPLVDMSAVLRELMPDIGDRAGSSFAIYCRKKEANSINSLKQRMKNIEADRQATASADNRMDKAGKQMEKARDQSSTYDPSGMTVRSGPASF